ncbi:MAG: DUF1156 domain-containing protein [Candidatus Hodarchaeales archaeon]|jgi:adenine-specific DNA methylase
MKEQVKSSEKAIENCFPFSKVSEIAYKESNAKRYYRPVLTLHKWFARRLGSVFRSILIYASLSSSINEVEDDTTLSKDHSLTCTEDFWDVYLQEHDFKDIVVLDPFMGGGTTIIEAKRLGFRVIGGDLNPVAWFTVKKELDEVNLDDLRREFEKLSSKLKIDLLKYYKTQCESCSEQADVMYFFWVKEIQCEHCARTLPLFRSYLFAYDRKDSTVGYFICPKCESIFQEATKKSLHCPDCGCSFDPFSYIAKRGKYYCYNCEHTAKIVDVNIKQGKPVERLYALEYYCTSCNTRDFKRASKEDLNLYHQACHEFKSVQDQLPLPHQGIPVGAKTQELLNHKILSFDQMFNSRQLLSLGKLLGEILQIPDINLREFFLLTFSTSLEYSNLLCEYHRKNHYIYNLFRKHAFPATLNPVENNVWGTKLGTGTFKNFFAKTIRIKEFCKHPYEYYIDETGATERKPMLRPIIGNIVSSYPDLLQNPVKNVFLYCSSSNHIKIPTDSVDLVVTDPPYYDNVQYAELSDFYYVWLQLGLKDYYPWFEAPLAPKKAEIVKNTKIGKTSKDYQQGLTAVFTEISRVLKPEGLLIFTFHHKQLKAWTSIIQGLLDNSFYIKAVYPVRAEMKTSTQIRGKKSIEFDVVFICRKWLNTTKRPMISWKELISIIERNVKEKICNLTEKGGKLSDEDKIVIHLGVGLKFFTQFYPEIRYEGKFIPLEAAMEQLSSIL